MILALGALADPPLVPSPDEARGGLRRELLRPEYNDENLIQRVLDWIKRAFNDSVEAVSSAPPLAALAAILAFAALAVALSWLLSRARTAARPRDTGRAVLTDEKVSAANLRRRAEEALDGGRHEAAVVDGFRALAVRQVERGRIDDVPGATAHEVADSLAALFVPEGPRVDQVARLFDAVLYGGRPATRADAASVLVLDDELARR